MNGFDASPAAGDPVAALAADDLCFLRAAPARRWLEAAGGPLADLDAFRASWHDLRPDAYMADGGRYRLRRHATLAAEAGAREARVQPHAPHYQAREYNQLNGGIARHFEPIDAAVLDGATMRAALAAALAAFSRARPGVGWHIEAHQFRITASPGEAGKPTPEGVHRDGVDFVMVMLIDRVNVDSGTTTIHAPDGSLRNRFTLAEPFDTVLLDDRVCLHGVTPIHPLRADAPAYRDVLVLTYRAR